MSIKVGDVVYLWPRVAVTVERIESDGRLGVVWFDHKQNVRRRLIDETKIISKR